MSAFICKHHGRIKKSELYVYMSKVGERRVCKLCKKEWREKNKARLKKAWRKYYQKNRKRILAKQAIYFQNNKEYYYAKKREARLKARRAFKRSGSR